MVNYKINVINDDVKEFSVKTCYYPDPAMEYLHCIITDNIVICETMLRIGAKMSDDDGSFDITEMSSDTDAKSIKYRFKMNEDKDDEYEISSLYQPKDSNLIVSLHNINKPHLRTHFCIKINGPKEPLKVISKFYSPDSTDDKFVSVCDKMNKLIENEVIKKWCTKTVDNVPTEEDEDVNNE